MEPWTSRGGTRREWRSSTGPDMGAEEPRGGRSPSNDWILSLDADEHVPADLADEIRRVLETTGSCRLSHSARDVVSRALDQEHRLVSRPAAAAWTIDGRALEPATGARVGGDAAAAWPPETRARALRRTATSPIIWRPSIATRRSPRNSGQPEGRRTTALAAYPTRRWRFLRNYVLRGGFRDGGAGLLVSALNRITCS